VPVLPGAGRVWAAVGCRGLLRAAAGCCVDWAGPPAGMPLGWQ
jgi:hypothetical protein